MFLTQLLKVSEGFLGLFSCSLLIGVIWHICCEIQGLLQENEVAEDNFLTFYDLERIQGTKKLMVLLTYFGVTTLTTVGLGDFHPQSNVERIFCTVIMVSGVTLFSLLYQKVNEAISKINQLNNPLNDVQNELETFFGVIKRFNCNYPLKQSICDQI